MILGMKKSDITEELYKVHLECHRTNLCNFSCLYYSYIMQLKLLYDPIQPFLKPIEIIVKTFRKVSAHQANFIRLMIFPETIYLPTHTPDNQPISYTPIYAFVVC